jgi:SAM-dependent methyltransferase
MGESAMTGETFWPETDLERVAACPVCRSQARTLLHDHLRDLAFGVAPGEWTLWSCGACRSAYLDPRPTEASIGRAYESYYTHAARAAPEPGPQGGLRSFVRSLANGYRNARYGARSAPASALGALLAPLAPPLHGPIDAEFRFLGPMPPGEPPKILDVGCGDGAWIARVRALGWDAVGNDPDPKVVESAASRGLQVRAGGIEAWSDAGGTFDAVSMSHVIEHLHDPLEALAKALALLRPGGFLYLETPNIDAFGAAEYGPAWRGLEPPRHLVLFNRASLSHAVKSAGFSDILFYPKRSVHPHLRLASETLAARLRGEDAASEPAPPRLGILDRLRARTTSDRTEFLTLTARKPGGKAGG